jgi:AsmA-like C-terminal region/AsmA family
VQATLLGLAIAFIIALIAALIGPFFVDWNQFRPQFEAEAARVIGAPVRVAGELDARLLPSPSLRLRSVVVGGANDLGKVRADKLDVEFSLGSLMRGEWRATELTISGMALDLGLDAQGRIDWPASTGKFSLGSLSIDRLNLTGRAALHDALSRSTLELNEIAFSGDVRSLAGSVRGDGSVSINDVRYPFRISSGQSADGNGTRIHLNIDPGTRGASAELDGVLGFEARAPRFEGALTLTGLPGPKVKGADPAPPPWRVSAKVRADHAAAKLDQIEVSYGGEERAFKLVGLGDVRFGASPLIHATLSARNLDADRFAAKENPKENAKDSAKDSAAEPARALPVLRALVAAAPELPIAAQFEIGIEQIMLGGRPLQNFAAEMRTEAGSWTIGRLDVRAPGATRVSLSGGGAQRGPSGSFKGMLSIDSTDPDALMMWLQGRSELTSRSQKPLRLSGNINLGADRIALEAIRCELDGGAVEGRIAVSRGVPGGSLEAELKADRLDLDSASAFTRALLGPQGEWPEQAKVSLDVAHAVLAAQELRPFMAKLGYGPKTVALEQLKIGEPGGVIIEGFGAFDRVNTTGTLALNSSAASLGRIAGMIAPLAPTLAARLNSLRLPAGPSRLKLALALDKDASHADRSNTRATLDLDAPRLKGSATITSTLDATALRAIDLDRLQRSEVSLESKLSSDNGPSLVALLGLDGVLIAGDGPAQFQGSLTGKWGSPLRLDVRLSGAGLEAEAQGTADPFAPQSAGSVAVKARNLNLAPLFGLKSSDKLAQNISLSSRLSLSSGKLKFEDLDAMMAGSRLRGHVAVTLDGERNVDGEIGLDALEIAPAFALGIGAGGDASEPLGAGLLKGWRGRIAFQALRGLLPGGAELRPLSGIVKGDGQSLVLDGLKGSIAGGEATGSIEARTSPGGLALNARLQLDGADAGALHYRALTMPAGRASLKMTLSTQGRSASAIAGALSGSGAVTLESARITGLDPRAFDVAIRGSDAGQATDEAHLRKIVEPALSGGALLVASAQIPFTIRDGRVRVDPTTLDSDFARAIVSGGYDIPADQVDIRATLASRPVDEVASRPEIVLFAAGTPDLLHRSVDVAPLSSWLALRAIDRETRRLDSIERGETPPTASPASIPRNPTPPPIAPKPRVFAPRPPAGPQGANSPPANTPTTATSVAGAPGADTPVVSQQVPPLPPPIEVRPAPSPPRPARPRQPLLLTPPNFASPQGY